MGQSHLQEMVALDEKNCSGGASAFPTSVPNSPIMKDPRGHFLKYFILYVCMYVCMCTLECLVSAEVCVRHQILRNWSCRWL